MVLIVAAMWACQSGSQGLQEASLPSMEGYELEPIPGTELVRATKKDADGQLLETGFLQNNKMQGTWLYYEHTTKDFPKRVINYQQGVAQGLYLEMTERGQIDLQAFYENNELHGLWGIYKFGRPVKTANYKHGILDGVYREYALTNGKLQKEIYYKDGKEDGPYRYFNEDGEIMVEYEFRNGEKVSGGVVDK